MARALMLATALVLGTSGAAFAGGTEPVTTTAAAEPSARSFRNCTALNRVYPQGVGKPRAVNKVNGRRTNDKNHRKSLPLYRANKHLDRDGDGVACER